VVGENGVVLDFEDVGFGEVLKDLHDGGDFGNTHVLRCNLGSVGHEFLWDAARKA
jgi:hypothetical protein